MIKNKKIKSFMILIFVTLNFIGCSKIQVKPENTNKSLYNFDYELPSNITVRDIIDKNLLIVEQDNDLFEYDYQNNKFSKQLITKNKDESFVQVKNIGDKIIYSLLNEDKSYSKIIINDIHDKLNNFVIDEIAIPIDIRFEIDNENIVYLNNLDERYSINIFNTKTLSLKNIYNINSKKGEETSYYVSYPSISNNTVVWSTSEYNNNNEINTIYKYDISSEKITIISSDIKVVAPVIINDLLLGIKLNTKKISSSEDEFIANYLVKYAENNWVPFADPKENNMKYSEKNTVFSLRKFDNYIYWIDSINNGYYLYDSITDKFITIYELKSKNDYTLINYNVIKDGLVSYTITFNDEKFNVLKKID